MNYFKGILDDIAIYNRSLTPCDIETIYNQQNPEVAGLDFNADVFENLIFPNPANGILNINSNDFQSITISNTTGQVIKKINLDSTQIDISDLNNGIYFLQLFKKDGFTSVQCTIIKK